MQQATVKSNHSRIDDDFYSIDLRTDMLDEEDPELQDDRLSVHQKRFYSKALVAIGFAIWLLIDSLNPARETLATASIEIDLASIEQGETKVFTWLD